MIETCPHCGRKLMTRNSPLCSWCGEKIEDPEYQAGARAGRDAAKEEQSRLDAGRAAFHEDMKRATLMRRAGMGRIRVGPSPTTVAEQRIQQLNANLNVDIVAAQAQADRAKQEQQPAPVQPEQPRTESKGPYRAQ